MFACLDMRGDVTGLQEQSIAEKLMSRVATLNPGATCCFSAASSLRSQSKASKYSQHSQRDRSAQAGTSRPA
jgi:hypothetical protein